MRWRVPLWGTLVGPTRRMRARDLSVRCFGHLLVPSAELVAWRREDVDDLAVLDHFHRVLDATRNGVAVAWVEFVDRPGDGLPEAAADHVARLLMGMCMRRSVHAYLKSHPGDHRTLADSEQIEVHTEGL